MPPDGYGRGPPPLESERRAATNGAPDRKEDSTNAAGSNTTEAESPASRIAYIDEDGEPVTEEQAERNRQFEEYWEQEFEKKLLQAALDVAVGGRLREYVPFEPPWCRVLGDRIVTLLTMGKFVNELQKDNIWTLYHTAEKFKAAGRRAVDPTKDGRR
jgi:hypothetical protein